MGDVVQFDHIPGECFLIVATRIVHYEMTSTFTTELDRSVVIFFGTRFLWTPYRMMDEECTLIA